MSEQPKVTISFEVTPYYAALLIAAYDVFMASYPDRRFVDVAPQTLDNYTSLVGELLSYGGQLLEAAESYSPDTAKDIREFITR